MAGPGPRRAARQILQCAGGKDHHRAPAAAARRSRWHRRWSDPTRRRAGHRASRPVGRELHGRNDRRRGRLGRTPLNAPRRSAVCCPIALSWGLGVTPLRSRRRWPTCWRSCRLASVADDRWQPAAATSSSASATALRLFHPLRISPHRPARRAAVDPGAAASAGSARVPPAPVVALVTQAQVQALRRCRRPRACRPHDRPAGPGLPPLIQTAATQSETPPAELLWPWWPGRWCRCQRPDWSIPPSVRL